MQVDHAFATIFAIGDFDRFVFQFFKKAIGMFMINIETLHCVYPTIGHPNESLAFFDIRGSLFAFVRVSTVNGKVDFEHLEPIFFGQFFIPHQPT